MSRNLIFLLVLIGMASCGGNNTEYSYQEDRKTTFRRGVTADYDKIPLICDDSDPEKVIFIAKEDNNRYFLKYGDQEKLEDFEFQNEENFQIIENEFSAFETSDTPLYFESTGSMDLDYDVYKIQLSRKSKTEWTLDIIRIEWDFSTTYIETIKGLQNCELFFKK